LNALIVRGTVKQSFQRYKMMSDKIKIQKSALMSLGAVILPLNEVQLGQLPTNWDGANKPVRFLADEQCVNIVTGYAVSKELNIIDHYMYWDRPKGWIDMVLGFLRKNNPKVTFKVTYH